MGNTSKGVCMLLPLLPDCAWVMQMGVHAAASATFVNTRC
jgi:hypothetical protein